jgi:hypothetical protein
MTRSPNWQARSSNLIHDEEFCPLNAPGPVWGFLLANSVALSTAENEFSSILQLGHELALQDMDNMPSLAPMVGKVARRILDDTYSNATILNRPPASHSVGSRVFHRIDFRPIQERKWAARKKWIQVLSSVAAG